MGLHGTIPLEEQQVGFLREFEELDREESRRKRSDGFSYFIPNQKQLDSFRSDCPTVIIVAGNRIGKTTSGCMELIAHCLGRYPSCSCHGEWFSLKRRLRPPVKGPRSRPSPAWRTRDRLPLSRLRPWGASSARRTRSAPEPASASIGESGVNR